MSTPHDIPKRDDSYWLSKSLRKYEPKPARCGCGRLGVLPRDCQLCREDRSRKQSGKRDYVKK
jgi:hypothetical protein